MQRVSATMMRRRFGRYLDMVADGREPVIIFRAGRPMAVLVPVDQYEEYEQRLRDLGRRRHAAASMDRLRSRLASRGRNVDVVRMVRSMRDSR
jgi:prevent-host-death family protein